jgi:hypothetical protein
MIVAGTAAGAAACGRGSAVFDTLIDGRDNLGLQCVQVYGGTAGIAFVFELQITHENPPVLLYKGHKPIISRTYGLGEMAAGRYAYNLLKILYNFVSRGASKSRLRPESSGDILPYS